MKPINKQDIFFCFIAFPIPSLFAGILPPVMELQKPAGHDCS